MKPGATTIALLRGINVGGHRLAMADLRALYESLGASEVRTLLASGNVVFRAPAKATAAFARRVEPAFAERFGFAAPTAFVTADQLARVIAANPLPMAGVNPSRCFVGFPVDGDMPALRAALALVLARSWAPECLMLGEEASYFLQPDGIHDSPLAKAVDKAVRQRLTMRNWATLLKLQAEAAR